MEERQNSSYADQGIHVQIQSLELVSLWEAAVQSLQSMKKSCLREGAISQKHLCLGVQYATVYSVYCVCIYIYLITCESKCNLCTKYYAMPHAYLNFFGVYPL